MIRRVLLALWIAALASPVSAAVLYKSVSANGVVQFSDLPPENGVEAKAILVPDSSSAATGGMRSPTPEVVASARTPHEQVFASDDTVQRASMQVDLAEHALAVARRPLWEIADPMRLTATRMNRADQERIDFYQKNLRVAKQQLADLLRARQRAELTMTAEAGAPIYGPSSPIYRR